LLPYRIIKIYGSKCVVNQLFLNGPKYGAYYTFNYMKLNFILFDNYKFQLIIENMNITIEFYHRI